MACVSKIGSLYELVTKNVVVTTTNTIFGINPRIWLSLPCEGLLLLKIRQVTLENPVGNRIPIGFLFDRSLIMITFVRGRSFVHRKGGRE